MRQSATFTTRINGNLVRTPRPLTKGGALLKAREILGPSAGVRSFVSNCTLTMDNLVMFTAVSWEQALKLAEESPEAERWNDKVIADANELANAINSLRATAIAILKKGVKHLTKAEYKFVVKGYRAHP